MKAYSVLIALCTVSGMATGHPQHPQPVEIVPAFLLIGQSNMEGLAVAAELSPGPYQGYLGPQAAVQLYNRVECAPDCVPGTVLTTWMPLDAGVNTSPCFPGSMGPEVSLGKQLADQYGKTVYLVKYAVGATWLSSQGQPPEKTWSVSNGCLWSNALEHLEAARAALPAGKVMRIRGIFWEQGVFDSGNPASATAYEGELVTLIQTLRSYLDTHSFTSDATVPFVISQVPDFVVENYRVLEDEEYFDTVRCAQQAVACALPDVGLFDPVDAYGLGAPPNDNFHMDASDQIEHGIGLFEAFMDQGCPSLSLLDCSILYAGDTETSLTFLLDAPAHAGRVFVLLGSDIGNRPGTDLAGQHFPLNYGTYFYETLLSQSPYLEVIDPLPDVYGVAHLDENGQALVTFTPTATMEVEMEGQRFHHAFAVIEDNAVAAVSNAVSLTVYPAP